MIRVVLTDDHPVVRHGLAAMIDIEDDIEVIGQAENGEEAIKLAHALKPDVMLMDLQMPVMDGVPAIKRIKRELPDIQIIILTTFADDAHIRDGIIAGARGYLLKDAPPDDLIEAIRAAAEGKSLLDPAVAARLLDQFSSMAQPEPPPEPPAPEAPDLTPREMDVLHLLKRGLRNKDIAAELFIVERTVKIHVGNILGKLNASNRTEAVAIARRLGLLE